MSDATEPLTPLGAFPRPENELPALDRDVVELGATPDDRFLLLLLAHVLLEIGLVVALCLAVT